MCVCLCVCVFLSSKCTYVFVDRNYNDLNDHSWSCLSYARNLERNTLWTQNLALSVLMKSVILIIELFKLTKYPWVLSSLTCCGKSFTGLSLILRCIYFDTLKYFWTVPMNARFIKQANAIRYKGISEWQHCCQANASMRKLQAVCHCWVFPY